jgi:ariadne-1
MVTCGTCFTDCQPENCTRMDCDHTYCNDCWTQHIRTQVADGNANHVKCMAFRCGIVCDEDKVRVALRAQPALLELYEQRRLQSFMDANAGVRFCPR